MIDGGDRARFLFEARLSGRIASRRRWQHLERDVAMQAPVARTIDFAHTAGPDGGNDLVRTQAGAGLEAHG
jgi:hypothetical protein